MSLRQGKERYTTKKSRQRRSPSAPRIPRELGLHAFQAARYTDALRHWERLDLSDDRLRRAVAEAHFRQGILAAPDPLAVVHLDEAARLVPDDPIYAYHYGLGLQRRGWASLALPAYLRAVANGLQRPDAGAVIALAALRLNPAVDLATVAGVSPDDRRQLAPFAPLLRALQAKTRPRTLPALWQELQPHLQSAAGAAARALLPVLAELTAGHAAAARQALQGLAKRPLSPRANAIRLYFAGVAAAQTGDLAAAVTAWTHAGRLELESPALRHNLEVGCATQAAAQLQVGDWSAAGHTALEGLKLLPGNARLSDLVVTALDRAARAAIEAGDWASAAQSWARARDVLQAAVSVVGTPRPILHNLALAYEALAQWTEAAEAWRAMLRTRPRKKVLEGWTAAHWTWVRQRVIECYKKAGRPDEAIVMFRQALKADPDDVDLQLDLAEAQAANEQPAAAIKTLEQLVDQHPGHIEALIRLTDLYVASRYWAAAEPLLKRALAVQPDHPELRRRMATLLVGFSEEMNYWKQYDEARRLLERALEFDPGSWSVQLNLARVAFNTNAPDTARGHIERALELGRGHTEAYEQALMCWMRANRLDEARAVLARAEAESPLSKDALIRLGLQCIDLDTAPPGPPALMTILGKGKPVSLPVVAPLTDRQRLGQELLDRAVALGPEIDVLHKLLVDLERLASPAGLPYARRLVQLTPEDPLAWMMLGVYLGLSGQVKEAQDALRTVVRLGRQQGNSELSRAANELRRAVGDPFFAMTLRLHLMTGELGFDHD